MFFFKFISFFYLIIISILFLTPLNFFIVNSIIDEHSHPSNNTSYILHFVIFFVLYLLFSFSFSSYFRIVLFCVVYAFLIEILQIYFSRGFQFSDIFFNFLGIIISNLFLSLFKKKRVF